jgi:hypothetical protein
MTMLTKRSSLQPVRRDVQLGRRLPRATEQLVELRSSRTCRGGAGVDERLRGQRSRSTIVPSMSNSTAPFIRRHLHLGGLTDAQT